MAVQEPRTNRWVATLAMAFLFTASWPMHAIAEQALPTSAAVYTNPVCANFKLLSSCQASTPQAACDLFYSSPWGGLQPNPVFTRMFLIGVNSYQCNYNYYIAAYPYGMIYHPDSALASAVLTISPTCPNATPPYTFNPGTGMCERPDQCLPPNVINPDTGECEPPETYTITLKPDRTTIEPSTNLGLTVTVENQDHQPPKNPVQVKISLKVDHKSGGHDHGDSTRPRGGINSKDCVSDDTCVTLSIGGPGSSGSTSITFNARDASGEHTIAATCDKCSNGPQEAKVDVKVKESQQPDWDTITASPTEYALIGGETGKTHHDNHYLTGKARENLLALVDEYNKAFPSGPLLQLNDASLVWGGRFDINGKWSGAHSNHRRGVVIDIRANQDVTAIPQARFDQFEAMAKKSGAYADLHCAFSGKYICPACLLDTGPNRHYHVRLLGQGIDR